MLPRLSTAGNGDGDDLERRSFALARDVQEQEVIDRFTAYLAQVTGRTWEFSPDEVSTLKNARNYDCEFTSAGVLPIAADVTALYPVGSNQKDQAQRAKLNARLLPELRKVGLGGLIIRTPPIQKKHGKADWPRVTAAKIRDTLMRQPLAQGGEEIEVDGCTIKRIADDSEPSFFTLRSSVPCSLSQGWGIPLPNGSGTSTSSWMLTIIQRYLIAFNEGCRAHGIDVRDACAFIKFNHYPNFERVYFEESPGIFHLAYDREAWHSMEAGILPEDEERRGLVIFVDRGAIVRGMARCARRCPANKLRASQCRLADRRRANLARDGSPFVPAKLRVGYASRVLGNVSRAFAGYHRRTP